MTEGDAPGHVPDGKGVDLGIEGITDARHIGSGGAADVYKAEQPRLGRTVAVKVLRANTSAENRSRFEREAQTLGRLSNHPGIVTLHEAGLTGIGQPFLMMEFCEAGTLADRTAVEGKIGWQEACRIVSDISEVVDDAHDAGVLHRDLKPANVLIDSRGKHLVADFGVAALSDTGNFSAAADFTPGYAPPETLRGEPATPAGDIYSLGATAHALITGRVPFEATDNESNNVLAWIRRIETEPPGDLRPFGVPDAVASVIEASMNKEPTNRPSAQDFTEQLSAAAEGRPIPGIAVTNAPPMPPGGDPATTAISSVLPQKPVTGQPPVPGQVPPMPSGPATGPTTGPVSADPITGEQPAVSADLSGHTTAVPQLLPQKPTSIEVPGRDGSLMPPLPGQPATGQTTAGQPTTGQPTTGQPLTGQPPVPPGPTTGPVPTDATTGPVPFGGLPSGGVPTGPVADIGAPPGGPITGPAPTPPVGPITGPGAPSQPVPSQPVPSQPVPSQPIPSQPVPSQPIPSQPIPSQPVPSQPIPSQPIPSQPVPSQPVPSQPIPNQPIGNGPTTGPITGEHPAPLPSAAPPGAPSHPLTTPTPFRQPETGSIPPVAQPATASVPPSFPAEPGPAPVAESDGGNRKGLLIAGGVLGVAVLGLGGLLATSLGGEDDTATSTTASITTQAPTTASTTSTTASTTTTTPTTLAPVSGPAAGAVSDASIVLTGAVPDQETADAIVAATATVYGEAQITSELEIDATVEVVELTLNGTLSNNDNRISLIDALDEIENVDVVADDLIFESTTTTAAPPPTRQPTTTRRATTAAPTTTSPPIGTQNTNPTIG